MRGIHSLRVYNASVSFARRVAELLAATNPPHALAEQLGKSSRSIGDNIAEGHGRGPGKDRLRLYRIARGEAQESLNQLKGLSVATELAPEQFWPLFNLGRAIVRMLDRLIEQRPDGGCD